MKATISEKKEIAEGTLYLKLSLDGTIDFKPGQFFRLTLIDPPYTDDRGNGRYLGFINSPSYNGVVETVFRQGPSAFKKFLSESPLGTRVEIGEISGEMIVPENTEIPWIIVTGGIGIVPYMSMIRYIREKALLRKITLIYSNTKESWAIFMDELNSYSQENQNFKLIATMTQDANWKGETRRISEDFLRGIIEKPLESLVYVSGTPRFVPSIVSAIKVLGVTPDRLKFEIFTGY